MVQYSSNGRRTDEAVGGHVRRFGHLYVLTASSCSVPAMSTSHLISPALLLVLFIFNQRQIVYYHADTESAKPCKDLRISESKRKIIGCDFPSSKLQVEKAESFQSFLLLVVRSFETLLVSSYL